MKIPRNLSGKELIKKLEKLGYEVTRQVGNHVRLTIRVNETHHITIPIHKPIKVGTLSAILTSLKRNLLNGYSKTTSSFAGLCKFKI